MGDQEEPIVIHFDALHPIVPGDLSDISPALNCHIRTRGMGRRGRPRGQQRRHGRHSERPDVPTVALSTRSIPPAPGFSGTWHGLQRTPRTQFGAMARLYGRVCEGGGENRDLRHESPIDDRCWGFDRSIQKFKARQIRKPVLVRAYRLESCSCAILVGFRNEVYRYLISNLHHVTYHNRTAPCGAKWPLEYRQRLW